MKKAKRDQMFEKFLLKDTAGKKSVTVTAFVLGFLVVNAKLLVSGITVAGYTMAAFTGAEYGVALSALGGIYVLRRALDGKKDDDSKKK
jgi:hypothetical protein